MESSSREPSCGMGHHACPCLRNRLDKAERDYAQLERSIRRALADAPTHVELRHALREAIGESARAAA